MRPIEDKELNFDSEVARKACRIAMGKEAAWQRVASACHLGEHAAKPQQAPVVPMWRRFMRVAAVLLPLVLVGALAFGLFGRESANPGCEYYASAGQLSVEMPDGSTALLEEGSRLSFVQDAEARHATLSGRAFFSVHRDESRPFSVQAADATVQVLGTKFHVENWDGHSRVRTCVTEGLVSMSAGGQAVRLHAGEEAVWNEGHLDKRLSAGSHSSLADKHIDFTGATLRQVVDELLSCYHGQLAGARFSGHEDSTRITTVFHGQSLESVIEELNMHFDKKIALSDGYLTISD